MAIQEAPLRAALTAQDHSLVALSPVSDLLLCAKHLFDPAMVAGCGVTWYIIARHIKDVD
jgi:hypothetical protein